MEAKMQLNELMESCKSFEESARNSELLATNYSDDLMKKIDHTRMVSKFYDNDM